MVLETGARIGRYEILRKLGQGGFGVLYTAIDSELGREVALKLLRPEHVLRPQVVQRFLQEARAAARISHPGIVTVYESGQLTGTNTTSDGTVYIAMELLTGETLAQRLKRVGRMPHATAIGFAKQLAAALAAAHQTGIVHRDLKPQNVFLVPDGAVVGGERVKILDFGIAKLVDGLGSALDTNSMLMLGTPMYMSPEQCKSSAKVDARTDIYSLGCILFEMLCGQPPFDGDSGELIAKHQLVPPPAPRALAPDIPPWLDSLVGRLLAKSPDDRPQTMAMVLDELDDEESPHGLDTTTVPFVLPISKHDDDRMQSTLSEAASAQTPRPQRWHPGRNALLAGGTMAIVIGVGIGIWSARETKPTPRATSTVAPRNAGDSMAALTPSVDAAIVNEAQIERTKNQCLEAQLEKRWSDLAACADTLAPLQPEKAAEFKLTAQTELSNELSLGRLEAALEANDMVAAKRAFEAIDESSVFFPIAETRYNLSVRPNAAPTKVAVKPQSKTTCDADELRDLGLRFQQKRQHAAALAKFEASLACQADQYVQKLAFVAACNAKNADKARQYFARLTASQRGEAVPVCERNKVSFGCDAAALKDKAMKLVKLDELDDAVEQFEASLRCKPDTYVASLAFAAACRAKDHGKARQFHPLMAAADRGKVRADCEPIDKTAKSGECDAEALKDRGMEQINMGQHAAALTSFEASLRCSHDSYVTQLAFMSACSAMNAAKAKYYFKQLTPAQQQKFAQICIRMKVPFE